MKGYPRCSSATLLLALLATGHNHGGYPGCNAQSSYANITLKANNGDLSAVVFLPHGIKPGQPTYYRSTRFDHGSMIGEISRTKRNSDGSKASTHVLYGNQQWRVPHDPYWPESGIGLASEFGVGDDGAFCNYRCGWYQINEVTNGVLGYPTAKVGESFLKIGVGELIKGSCSSCDSTEDFKFNSPYEFAKEPVWTLNTDRLKWENTIELEHEALLDPHGYRLKKEITLNDDELVVKSTLENKGREPFATAWYSHHFYTCDSHPVAKGLGADLDLVGTKGRYDEPGTWFWSTPLENYASVEAYKDKVSVDMERGLERDVRIKAEFEKDEKSKGGFTIRGCETSIKETIPELDFEEGSDVSMYAFNLYIESGTFSPEPQIYMHLWPGQTISWTQKLELSDLDETQSQPQTLLQSLKSVLGAPLASATGGGSETTPKFNNEGGRHRSPLSSSFTFVIFVISSAFFSYTILLIWRRKRRQIDYSPVPDQDYRDNDDNHEQEGR